MYLFAKNHLFFRIINFCLRAIAFADCKKNRRAFFISVSKSSWFFISYTIWGVKLTCLFFYPIRSKTQTKSSSLSSVFPRFSSAARNLLWALIGSLYCLGPLWLASVITLVLVLQRSIENHSNVLNLTQSILCNVIVAFLLQHFLLYH